MNPHDDAQRPRVEGQDAAPPVRAFRDTPDGYRWDAVSVLAYKPTGVHFQGIARQVLFDDPDDLACQLRYFEVQPGGYSTLERHAHVHAVLILQGRGRVLVGETVYPVAAFDLVRVPPQTWHQFRAYDGVSLGFLCLVSCDRDRPVRPDADDLEALRAHPVLADFIRL